jgi:peroxiredoxin
MVYHLSAGSPAPDYTLWTADGSRAALNQVWGDGPTVVTFLRHFGCLFCREWLKTLEKHQTDFARAGVKIVAIAQGKPAHAARYCGDLAPSTTCLVDEGTNAYNLYGLGRGGMMQLMGPKVFTSGMRAVMNGASVGEVIGDPLMMPGTFIIDRAGTVRYAYYSEHAGDHPHIDTLIRAAQAARA